MYGNTFIYEIWIKNILIKIIWTIVFFSKLDKLLMQLVIVVCLYMFHISWQHFSTKDEIVPITVVIAILTLILIKKTHSTPHGEQFKIGINNLFWITMKYFYIPKHNPCIFKIGKIYHKFLIWNKRGRNSSLCMMPLKQTQFQSFENLVSYFLWRGPLKCMLYFFMLLWFKPK